MKKFSKWKSVRERERERWRAALKFNASCKMAD
jgi:hypothetical protein